MATFTYPNETQFIYPIPGGGGGGGGDTVEVEYRTLTGGEAAAKAITLANAPADVSEVSFQIAGGGVQIFGTDFTVSGSTLSWNGLGLDGILTAGDELWIFYTI